MQTRVEEVRDGNVRLSEVEVTDRAEADTDSALLDAGHPTLTELRSVEADGGHLVRKWLTTREG